MFWVFLVGQILERIMDIAIILCPENKYVIIICIVVKFIGTMLLIMQIEGNVYYYIGKGEILEKGIKGENSLIYNIKFSGLINCKFYDHKL